MDLAGCGPDGKRLPDGGPDQSDGEKFRDYVMRHKVETFRKLTADLAKPAELFPEIYQDWGDDVQYSLQLGRGECAA